jgi:hypothetical protein
MKVAQTFVLLLLCTMSAATHSNFHINRCHRVLLPIKKPRAIPPTALARTMVPALGPLPVTLEVEPHASSRSYSTN